VWTSMNSGIWFSCGGAPARCRGLWKQANGGAV